MKNILYLLFFIAVSYKVTSQITYIPDQGFEQTLISLNIDSDGIVNGQVLTSDIENITELV
ncbi:MAG: T9SS C-terminal target domain-containing protein, partial [Flavobacteriaceae bacterium]